MESLPFESQCPVEEPNIVKLLYEMQLKKVILFYLGILFYFVGYLLLYKSTYLGYFSLTNQILDHSINYLIYFDFM